MKQTEFFSQLDIEQEWEKEWVDMPEFVQHDISPSSSINVQFITEEDRRAFLVMLGEKPARRQSIWWPTQEFVRRSELTTEPRQVLPNIYPIYIVSKGRWKSRITARELDKLCLPYQIVIEPQEHEDYAAVIPSEKILVLPFSNMGRGSIPARNWVWDHSIKEGHARHWQLDDNIAGFYRLNKNLKRKVIDENPFSACEDFTDRYTNVPMAGLNYESLCNRRTTLRPYRLNTRIYSCILLSNDEKYNSFRWRGRYNEDTDLSIRFLKAGYCTILFNAYLAKKTATMTMAGGNTEALYGIDDDEFNGRLAMAESLRDQHPDIVKVIWKWGRWQHQVDYRGFKKNSLLSGQK